MLRAPWLRNATNGATGTERNNKDKETQTTRGDESRRERRIYRNPKKREKKKEEKIEREKKRRLSERIKDGKRE